MMKLGVRCIVQKSQSSSNLGVIAPWVHTPKNAVLGYDVGKISAGCLVYKYLHWAAPTYPTEMCTYVSTSVH